MYVICICFTYHICTKLNIKPEINVLLELRSTFLKIKFDWVYIQTYKLGRKS